MTIMIRELFPRHPATEIKTVYKQSIVHDKPPVLKYSELCYPSSQTSLRACVDPVALVELLPTQKAHVSKGKWKWAVKSPIGSNLPLSTLLETGRAEVHV